MHNTKSDFRSHKGLVLFYLGRRIPAEFGYVISTTAAYSPAKPIAFKVSEDGLRQSHHLNNEKLIEKLNEFFALEDCPINELPLHVNTEFQTTLKNRLKEYK